MSLPEPSPSVLIIYNRVSDNAGYGEVGTGICFPALFNVGRACSRAMCFMK